MLHESFEPVKRIVVYRIFISSKIYDFDFTSNLAVLCFFVVSAVTFLGIINDLNF